MIPSHIRRARRMFAPVLLMLAGGAACAATVVIELDGSRALTRPVEAPKMAEVPALESGPNKGFAYGQFYAGPKGGATVNRGTIAAGGSIALHAVPTKYLLYVLRGGGVLVNTDPQGTESSRFIYGAGDLIVFEPQTFHRWENGPAQTEFLGIDLADGR